MAGRWARRSLPFVDGSLLCVCILSMRGIGIAPTDRKKDMHSNRRPGPLVMLVSASAIATACALTSAAAAASPPIDGVAAAKKKTEQCSSGAKRCAEDPGDGRRGKDEAKQAPDDAASVTGGTCEVKLPPKPKASDDSAPVTGICKLGS
jgi:uncharacterized membrane protein